MLPFSDTQKMILDKLQHDMTTAEFRTSMANIRNKEVIFVIGPTGSGKSTLVNYCLGSRYQVAGTIGFDAHAVYVQGSSPEKAKVGNSEVESETLIPGVYQVPGKSYRLCDLSGFGETRGAEFAVSGNVLSQVLLQNTVSVNKVILTLDIASINASRGNNIGDYFLLVKRVLGELTNKKLSNVVFAFTKLPAAVSAEDFIRKIIEPKEGTLASRTEALDEKDDVTLFVCRYLLTHPEKVVVVNPCDNGTSAAHLLTQCETANQIPLSKDSVDFLQQEPATHEFIQQTKERVQAYIAEHYYAQGSAARQQDRTNQTISMKASITNAKAALQNRKAINTQSITDATARLTNLQQQLNIEQVTVQARRQELAIIDARVVANNQEIQRITNLNNPIRINQQPFNTGGMNDYVVIVRGKRRYGFAGPKSTIMGYRPRAGNGTHIFTYVNATNDPISHVKINNAIVPHQTNRNQVSATHIYALAAGTNAAFEVFVLEKNTSANRNLVQQLQNTLQQNTQASQIKVGEIAIAEETVAVTMAQLNAAQTQVADLTTEKANIEHDEMMLSNTITQQQEEDIAKLEAEQVQDNQRCESFTHSSHVNRDCYIQVAELLQHLDQADINLHRALNLELPTNGVGTNLAAFFTPTAMPADAPANETALTFAKN